MVEQDAGLWICMMFGFVWVILAAIEKLNSSHRNRPLDFSALRVDVFFRRLSQESVDVKSVSPAEGVTAC